MAVTTMQFECGAGSVLVRIERDIVRSGLDLAAYNEER
jgi:hypothetical protein